MQKYTLGLSYNSTEKILKNSFAELLNKLSGSLYSFLRDVPPSLERPLNTYIYGASFSGMMIYIACHQNRSLKISGFLDQHAHTFMNEFVESSIFEEKDSGRQSLFSHPVLRPEEVSEQPDLVIVATHPKHYDNICLHLRNIFPSLPLILLIYENLLLPSMLQTKNQKGKQLFLFTTHKSASVYIYKVADKIGRYLNLNIIDVYSECDVQGKRLIDLVHKNSFSDNLYLNLRTGPEILKQCQAKSIGYKAVYVVRDPRDIIISLYYSYKYSHPTKSFPRILEHREKLQSMSFSSGLSMVIDLYGENVGSYMSKWLEFQDSDTITITYEQMVKDHFIFFNHICTHFRLDINPNILQKILRKYNFRALSERDPGQEDIKSHYRKGIIGDWRNYFTESHIRKFKDKYVDILKGYGYS